MRNKTGKKVMAAFLAAAVMSMAVPAYASEAEKDEQSMELNMSKDSTYMMSIPMSQSIAFGTVDTEIGEVSVTGDIGTKQKVNVKVSKTDFIDEKDAQNVFSFDLWSDEETFAGKDWVSEEVRAEEAVAYPLTVHIPTETWAGVIAGDYAATLTFEAELVDIE